MTDEIERAPSGVIPPPIGYPVAGMMTLRDWFAGQALIGMGTWSPAAYNHGEASKIAIKARYAYEVADAMLAARAAQ